MDEDALGNPCHAVTLCRASEHTEVKVLADHCVKDIIHQCELAHMHDGCGSSKIM